MQATVTRKMPRLAPKVLCCSKKWVAWSQCETDVRRFAKSLAHSLPSGAKPSPAQQAALAELKQHVRTAAQTFFEHVDDFTLEAHR